MMRAMVLGERRGWEYTEVLDPPFMPCGVVVPHDVWVSHRVGVPLTQNVDAFQVLPCPLEMICIRHRPGLQGG